MGVVGIGAAATLAAAVVLPATSWASPGAVASGSTSGGTSAGSTTATTTPGPTLPGVGSTTTTTPPTPTTTAPSGGTGPTTTAPHGSSGGGGGGVPSVPTGGPPTTAPAKPGTPPPPPPDPAPILTAVDADMTQLTAISEYPQAVNDVASRQQAVTSAVAGLQSAQTVLTAAQKAQAAASQRVETADQRLEHLAIAAYIGLGYATPAAGPQGVGAGGVGTVDTPGGLTGTQAADAQELLRLVAVHVRNEVTATRHALDRAKQATQNATDGVNQAEAGVAAAQKSLQDSQSALAVLTKAATVPGVAAQIGLLGLPSLDGSAPAAGAPGSQAASATPAAQPLRGAVDAAASKPAKPLSPSILGVSLLSGADLAAWFASTGHTANTTVPMSELATDYYNQGVATGVRGDVAFAQSIVETGYFSFPAGGQLTSADNNFAGIGACDSCAHGWHFPDALTGVSAQMQLLEAYASPKPVPTPLIGSVGVGGCCPDWMALAGKWATSTVYGISIMTVYQQMLAWAIPQHLTAAGLTAPAAPAVALGPSLAQLPTAGSAH